MTNREKIQSLQQEVETLYITDRIKAEQVRKQILKLKLNNDDRN